MTDSGTEECSFKQSGKWSDEEGEDEIGNYFEIMEIEKNG